MYKLISFFERTFPRVDERHEPREPIRLDEHEHDRRGNKRHDEHDDMPYLCAAEE